MLRENLAQVHQRIRQACERVGRDPGSVTLVAVTKGLPLKTIQEAAALGVTEVGENRVQEALEKQRLLGLRPKAEVGIRNSESEDIPHSAFGILHSIRWHLIGHLQRNKAKDAVELFGVIHSVDSLALADALERQAAKLAQGSRFEVQGKDLFVQVNISGEATKHGCAPDEVCDLAQRIRQRPHLRLRGLMTLAPFVSNPEDTRPHFRQLRQLRDGLASVLSLQPSALSLSMGMSQDFDIAIEEGADVVRIGTAIFGDTRQET